MSAPVELMGVRVDAVTEAEVVDSVLDAVGSRRGGWVVTPNLDVLRQVNADRGLRELVGGASLRVADGMPLLWAARLQGTPLPERVAGSALIYPLAAEASRRGASIFLLGGNPGAAEAAERELVTEFPGLRVAGSHCPPHGFEDDPAEVERMGAKLARTRPDIVFVGLGFPKQERLIARLRPHLPHAWFLGVGITLSFVAGEVRRAPRWMQELGLEWMHRMVQEPRRLARRYLVDGLPFAARLFGHALRNRARGGRRPPPRA